MPVKRLGLCTTTSALNLPLFPGLEKIHLEGEISEGNVLPMEEVLTLGCECRISSGAIGQDAEPLEDFSGELDESFFG